MAVGANQGLDLLHVGGIPHEAQGHPIDALAQAKGEVFPVFVGQGPDRELHVREVDALVVGEDAANGDGAIQGLRGLFDLVDDHFDAAVIQQDSAPGDHFIRQLVVGDRGDGLAALDVPGRQGEGVALGNRDRTVLEATEADLGALEVLQDSDVNPHVSRHLADGGDASRMLAVVTVGEVQAERGGTRLDQTSELFRGFGRGTDGCHDLGATREIGQGHSGAPKGRHDPIIEALQRCCTNGSQRLSAGR